MYRARYYSFRYICIHWNWNVNFKVFRVNVSCIAILLSAKANFHRKFLSSISIVSVLWNKTNIIDIKCPFHWRHLNWNVVPTETNETPLRNISANGNKYIEFRRCQIHLSFAITHWHRFKTEYIGFRSWQHNKIELV